MIQTLEAKLHAIQQANIMKIREHYQTDEAILIAYRDGEISEGMAARVLGVDRLELRTRVEALSSCPFVCDLCTQKCDRVYPGHSAHRCADHD